VRLQIWHDKAAREVTVKLGRAGDGIRLPAPRDLKVQPGQLGLSLRPLTRDELNKAHLQNGLLVQGVAGAAARAGLLPGDVLLDINGTPLKSVDQVKAVLEKKPKGVALLVWRDGDRIFVPVELE
jgi:serine protease Do